MYQKRLLPHRKKVFREDHEPLKVKIHNHPSLEEERRAQRTMVISKLHLRNKLQNAFKWTTNHYGGEL